MSKILIWGKYHFLGKISIFYKIFHLCAKFLLKWKSYYSSDIKVAIGKGGILYNLDAKIATMARCDVDLRLNLLKLLVSLTNQCSENTILVIRMKHWHTFINETLEEYPDIELHQLSIQPELESIFLIQANFRLNRKKLWFSGSQKTHPQNKPLFVLARHKRKMWCP